MEAILAHVDVEAACDDNNEAFDSERSGWWPALAEARNYDYGEGLYLEDKRLAREWYWDAIDLGSLEAYERLGEMLLRGEGGSHDEIGALKCWNEGARRGNYYCWLKLGNYYADISHTANASKCWANFIRFRNGGVNPEFDSENKYTQQLVLLLISGRSPDENLHSAIVAASASILALIAEIDVADNAKIRERLEIWTERLTPVEVKLERLRKRLLERKRMTVQSAEVTSEPEQVMTSDIWASPTAQP